MKPLFANQCAPGVRTILAALGKTKGSIAFLNSKIARAGCSPSPDRLQERIQQYRDAHHCDYDTAFRAVYAAHFANSSAEKPVSATGPVEDIKALLPSLGSAGDLRKVLAAASGSSGVPAPTAGLLSLFRLPADTTSAEWARAWDGNGSSVSPVNYGAIFMALVELTQAQRNGDLEANILPTQQRFPALWDAVEHQSRLSF